MKLFFLHPFLLLAYNFKALFMSCVLVKSWHCQYLSLSQTLFSRSNSLTTDSISWTWSSLYEFGTLEHLVLKCLAVPQLSFLDFLSLLWILNLTLKSMADPIYWSSQFLKGRWHYCCYKTIRLWHYKAYK